MGAAASADGRLELRALHNAISQSGVQNRTTNLSDLNDTHHLIKFDHIVESYLKSPEVDPTGLTEPEPTYGTPILFAASKAGGEETLAVVRLLRRVCVDDRDFQRALDWRDKDGMSCLHVARDGKVAACLLRAGCSHTESREFLTNLTPIQMAARKDNVDLVATMHAWGASDDGPPNTLVKGMALTRATDIALWQTVPERLNGNLVWLVLYDIVPLSRFGGIQWLNSEQIGRILHKSGVRDNVNARIVAGGSGAVRTSSIFPEGREATKSIPDSLRIECLPEELRDAARAYDVCCSGKICVSELRKIVRNRQKTKKFGDDKDILVADTARFNAIGGGDTLVQCRQRNLHASQQMSSTSTTLMRERSPSLKVSQYRTDNISQTYFVTKVNPSVPVHPVEVAGQKRPAGKGSGVCLEYGAESGDTPGWLKLPNTHRSADPWDSISFEEVSMPINIKARSSGYVVPKKAQDFKGAFDQALASTLEATKAIQDGERGGSERNTLWRPAGRNRLYGRIDDKDHLYLEKNPDLDEVS